MASVLLLTEGAALPTLHLPAGDAPSGVYFEPNLGQADPSVNFIGSGTGFKLFLEDDQLRASQQGVAEGGTIDIRFLGSSPDPVVTGAADLPGVSHYYLGSDPANWIENVRHFAEVSYEGVYPGIDLLVHSRYGNPEYDFVVQPGVDPKLIRLEIAGASEITLISDGSLRLGRVDGDPIVMAAPLIYQGDLDNRIEGAYEFFADGSIGFEIGEYDPSKTLVIDPELIFSTYVGGEGFEFVQGRGADSTGNYMCLSSTSNELLSAGGPIVLRDPPRVDDDVVCVKHGPSGQIEYVTTVGGALRDLVFDYSVDVHGNLHVAGGSESLDFPVTANALQDMPEGGPNPPGVFPNDGIVISLDPNGVRTFSTFLGGPGYDDAHAVAVAADGSMYVTGETGSELQLLASTGVSPTAVGPLGEGDGYALKLNPDRSIGYLKLIGGSSFDQGLGVAVNGTGELYVSGTTESLDFPNSTGAFQETLGGGQDGFLVKLSTDGDRRLYGTYIGGSRFESFDVGDLDADGNFVVAGDSTSPDFPTTADAVQRDFGGGFVDSVLVKLRAEGNGKADLVYSTFLGGSAPDYRASATVDAFNNIYITGATGSPDFPRTDDAFQASLSENPFVVAPDAFVSVINPSLPPAEQLLYSSFFGGSFGEEANGVGQDGLGNVYLVGFTDTPADSQYPPEILPPGFVGFPISDGVTTGEFSAAQPLHGGPPQFFGFDGFVAKFHIWDEVGIDIKPGNTRNNINPKSNGVFDLAILSSPSFYAPTEVDPATIRLEGAGVSYLGNGEANCFAEDVDEDGIEDVVCKIETNQLKLRPATPVANIVARTFGGDILMGQDSIQLR